MGKFLEYEVVSPLEIVYPLDFHDVAENIGHRVFSEPTRSEIRMWSSGATFSANKSFYHPVSPDKLRYYHYSKVEKNLGTLSLDFMSLSALLNTRYLEQNYIGSENLVDTIRTQIHESTGLCSLEDTIHEFEYVDVIDSEKREETKLFVLRQFMSRGPTNPLEVITKTAKERIEVASKGLEQVDFSTVSTLTDCIVVGWVENSPKEDAIMEFKETLTDRFKDYGAVKAKVKGLEINTAS